MYIPPTFALAAFVHTENIADSGTEPYVWTTGLVIGSADPVEIADALVARWVEFIAPLTTDRIFLDHVTLTLPAPGGGTGSVTSTEEPVTGDVTDDEQQYFVFAPKVRKLTDRLGRKGRGVFHPPGMLLLGDMDNAGNLAPAKRTAINEAWTDFATALPADGTAMALLHTNEADGTPDPITGLSVSPKVGIIRKRMA